MKKKKLFLFTAEYPYSIGETFIENEIIYLAENFDKILIFPFNTKGTTREVPNNVRICNIVPAQKIDLSDILLIIRILIYEFFKMKNKIFFLKEVRTLNALLKNAIKWSKALKVYIERENDTVVYYSYWMNDWALCLSILKMKKQIPAFLFRCGGFDIWDERHKGNYLPFRYFIYKYTSAIYPNSKEGERYIQNLHHYSYKVSCLYWGTADKGINPFNKNEKVCIVSCSRLVSLKRVGKIARTLNAINIPLKWVHFGDGELMQDLVAEVSKMSPNCIVELKGAVSNKEVLDYYSKHSITCFINVSTTESLPVSIQEAISFGIPVVATDVGGTRELVSEKTGLLIDVNYDEEQVAAMLKELIETTFTDETFRKNIRAFWKDNFSAAGNYKKFCERIIELTS